MTRQPPPPRGPRWGLVAGALATLLLAVTAALVYRQSGDVCRSWEGQLDQLSHALTRHRLAQGDGRRDALVLLEQLHLPCGEVEQVRDDCLAAYQHLALAEQRQLAARAALETIEHAIASLDQPWRGIAASKYLDGQDTAEIAQAQLLSQDQVRNQLAVALRRLGTDRMAQLHQTFDQAHRSSTNHVASARTFNQRCDRGYKMLLERAQNE